MSLSASNVFVCGLYQLCLALGLLFSPQLSVSLVGLSAKDGVWAELMGMLLLVLAFYFKLAGGDAVKAFFYWTLVTRLDVVLIYLGFVLAV